VEALGMEVALMTQINIDITSRGGMEFYNIGFRPSRKWLRAFPTD
jgi:hypothetical protein